MISQDSTMAESAMEESAADRVLPFGDNKIVERAFRASLVVRPLCIMPVASEWECEKWRPRSENFNCLRFADLKDSSMFSTNSAQKSDGPHLF